MSAAILPQIRLSATRHGIAPRSIATGWRGSPRAAEGPGTRHLDRRRSGGESEPARDLPHVAALVRHAPVGIGGCSNRKPCGSMTYWSDGMSAMATDWKPHVFRVGQTEQSFDAEPDEEAVENYRRSIEPWLSAVFQTEHLSLLVGSGFTTGVAAAAGVRATGMEPKDCKCAWAAEVQARSAESAKRCGRGQPNIEDQILAALELLHGLEIVARSDGATSKDDAKFKSKAGTDAQSWREALHAIFGEFITSILGTERRIREAGGNAGATAQRLLVSFLLSFASRAASRERLNAFTTNYDRLMEFACDLAGIRTLDRFVGALTPVFRSSRVDVDLHYNPPGIRGEPRYLEGVIRLTKLHGSVDWRWDNRQLRRYGIPFGAEANHPDVIREPLDSLMIYPNPAKDVDTLYYPYAELFRDLSAAICRPNSALVT